MDFFYSSVCLLEFELLLELLVKIKVSQWEIIKLKLFGFLFANVIKPNIGHAIFETSFLCFQRDRYKKYKREKIQIEGFESLKNS